MSGNSASASRHCLTFDVAARGHCCRSTTGSGSTAASARGHARTGTCVDTVVVVVAAAGSGDAPVATVVASAGGTA